MRLRWLVVGGGLALVACVHRAPQVNVPVAPSAVSEPAVKQFKFKHNGVVRTIVIEEPEESAAIDDGATGVLGRPLLLALSGAVGEGPSAVNLGVARLRQVAVEHGFVYAAPEPIESYWNDGRGVSRYEAHRRNIADSAFLRSLTDALIKDKRVDATRVFVIGVGTGGIMAHRFACEHADKFAALVTVNGSPAQSIRLARCRGRVVDTLMLHGTADPIVPYAGGDVVDDGVKLGRVQPAVASFSAWAKRAKCTVLRDDLERVAPAPAGAPNDDAASVESIDATGCVGEHRVRLISVRGGGHTWPSGWQYLPEKFVGRTTTVIDGTDVIWEFLQPLL